MRSSICLQDALQALHNLLSEFTGTASGAEAATQKSVCDIIQSNRDRYEARAIEDKAAIHVGSPATMPAKEIAFLRGCAESQPRQAIELAQKERWIVPWAALLQQPRQMEANGQEHSRVLPI